jgi:hypothetical protein
VVVAGGVEFMQNAKGEVDLLLRKAIKNQWNNSIKGLSLINGQIPLYYLTSKMSDYKKSLAETVSK